MEQKRYSALRTVGRILVVVGWITVSLGVLAGVISMVAGGASDSGVGMGGPLVFGYGLVVLVGGVLGGIHQVAIGHLIFLLIDVEANGRALLAALEQGRAPVTSTPPPVASAQSAPGGAKPSALCWYCEVRPAIGEHEGKAICWNCKAKT